MVGGGEETGSGAVDACNVVLFTFGGVKFVRMGKTGEKDKRCISRHRDSENGAFAAICGCALRHCCMVHHKRQEEQGGSHHHLENVEYENYIRYYPA